MKTLLKLLPLFPVLALAQSASVPIMGTAPVQPAPAVPVQTVQAQAAPPAPSPKQVQKRLTAPVVAKPQGEVLPPPSPVTRDFYQAFVRGNLPLADMLVQQGADVNCRNCGERTPIMMKIGHDLDAVRWIIARGADVNLPGPTWQGPMSPLMAASRSSMGAKETVLTLLQAGAVPNWQDLDGNTPFMMWAGRDFLNEYKIEGLVTMLSHGANINATNKMGQTALMKAIASSSNCAPQIVQFLLSRGADASLKTADDKTAATVAYQQALKGNTQCNQVMAILKSPPQPMADAPMPATTHMGVGSVSSGGLPIGEWQGVFNATAPRNASIGTVATISQGGEVVFSSQAGMRGTGRLNVVGNQVSGTFTAPSPVDANGRPMFTNPDGSSNIVFRINGTLSNGVMQGNYASAFESGNFAMCDPAAYERTVSCKPAQASAGDLIKAVGGLLGSLKGLSNATR